MCTLGSVESRCGLLSFKTIDKTGPYQYEPGELLKSDLSPNGTEFQYIPFFLNSAKQGFDLKGFEGLDFGDQTTTCVNKYGLAISGSNHNYGHKLPMTVHDVNIWLPMCRELMDNKFPKTAVEGMTERVATLTYGSGIYIVSGYNEQGKPEKYLVEYRAGKVRVKKSESLYLVSANNPQLFKTLVSLPDDRSRFLQATFVLSTLDLLSSDPLQAVSMMLQSHGNSETGSQKTICRHENELQGHKWNGQGTFATRAAMISVSSPDGLTQILYTKDNPCSHNYLRIF